jgi:hypothetical protein
LTLTETLDEYQKNITAWLLSSKRETQAIQKFAKAVELGNLRDIEKLRLAARSAGEAAGRQAVSCLPFEFNAAEYLSSPEGYLLELKKTAEQAGVTLYERDGVLFCYPVLVRLEPEAGAVRIDKKLEFNIHPKMLAARLKKEQGNEPKTKSEQFMEALFNAYRVVRDSDYQGAAVSVPLKRIYEILTLRPGSSKEYSLLDFTREIYFLDRSGITETKKGFRLSLTASTASREKQGDLLKFVTRDGHEKLYAGIKFTQINKEQPQ